MAPGPVAREYAGSLTFEIHPRSARLPEGLPPPPQLRKIPTMADKPPMIRKVFERLRELTNEIDAPDCEDPTGERVPEALSSNQPSRAGEEPGSGNEPGPSAPQES